MSFEKLDRRKFLKLTGRTSGGLILGASTLTAAPMKAMAGVNNFPLAPGVRDQALALNLFVQIETDGQVYLVAHRSEMGQGSKTGLPQVIADELGADWGKVTIVQADGNKAYGSQNTDGSRSVRNFYEKMREMGAAANLMLRQAAADKWGVSASDLEVVNHVVKEKKGKRSAGFGELAAAASQLSTPDPKSLEYKQARHFNYIGKPVEIVDLHDMTTGNTEFGIDVDLPDMVHASIEHCPYLGGGIESVDATDAKKVRGVIDVIKIEGQALPAAFHPLPGVAVIANNTWSAFEARKKLKIKWKKSPHQQHDSKTAMAKMLKALDEQDPQYMRKKGDPETALKNADSVVEAKYSMPYLVHAPMEPLAAAAVYRKDGIEAWAATQNPQSAQQELVNRFGLKPEQVTVHVTLLGGAFGRKAKSDYVTEAAILSKAVGGKPVKVTWKREDEIQNAYYHAQSALKLSAAMDADKKVQAFRAIAAYPSIMSLWDPKAKHPAKWELELGLVNTPFALQHEGIGSVPTEAHTRIGWMRSVCNIQQGFALGSFVDELAEAAGVSTYKMWMDLIGKDRNIDYKDHDYEFVNYDTPIEEYPYQTARLKHVLDTVRKASGFHKSKRRQDGWGLSCHYSFLTHVGVATRVEIQEGKLKVKEVHIAADCGLAVNPDRVKTQMEGSVIFALSAALMGEITFKDGEVEQGNFDTYPLLRMPQSPEIHVHLIESDGKPRGVGEPGVPPVSASLTNAIVAAGGKRIRDLPVNKVYEV